MNAMTKLLFPYRAGGNLLVHFKLDLDLPRLTIKLFYHAKILLYMGLQKPCCLKLIVSQMIAT